jgi:Protein of unknown function (DUF3592)
VKLLTLEESLRMTPLNVIIHGGGGGPVTGFEIKMFLLAAGSAILVGICWGAVQEWIDRSHARNWPTVTAVIDSVSVAFIQDNAPRYALDSSHFEATLTYVYRFPEEQMGDYSRSFVKKEDAEAWANSYKGETVKVHVDPRDPTRSLLREEDL